MPVEAVGAGGPIRPCGRGPKLPASKAALALALSGGGWRAALTAAGVLRFLADAAQFPRSSGGSITNALLADAPDTRRTFFKTMSPIAATICRLTVT
jgi:NTE family protein